MTDTHTTTRPELIQAVQHIRRMRGGSQSHLLRASDNGYYVTKFQNNPQHLRILANEFLGSRIGRLIGLPMPEVRIIEVSEWLIQNSPGFKIEVGGISVPCAPGLQFGSRYVCGPEEGRIFDYLPEGILRKIGNREDFPRVLVFDKWTCNTDGRQAVFVKRFDDPSYHATFIDQGHCFNVEWTFPDSALRGVFAQNAVYENVTSWESFEPVLSRVEAIKAEELRSLAREVPNEWYGHKISEMERLIDTLYARRLVVRDLVTSFRESTRSPFPRWRELRTR